MRPRTANLIALGLVVTALALLAASLVLHGLEPGVNDGLPVVLEQLPVQAFALVGALLLHRRADHRVGWLLAATGAANIFALTASQYTEVATRTAFGSSEAAAIAHVLGRNAQEISILLTFVLLPVLFPTGRIHARRWRWLPRVAVGLASISAVVVPLVPEYDDLGRNINPWGVESLREPLELLSGVTFVLTLLLAFPAVAALVSRYRAAEGVERLQLRWFTVSLVVLAGSFATILAWVGLWNLGLASNPSELTFDLVVITPMMGMPLSIAAAVLRYRLYDVDRVLSRTLSYALLTFALGAVYVSVVLTAQASLGRQGDAPDIVIAGATLLAAALFQPLRRRIQRRVDRRFARSRYDSAAIVAGFAARLRDQVQLETVVAELVAASDSALEPRDLSLWVAPTGARS